MILVSCIMVSCYEAYHDNKNGHLLDNTSDLNTKVLESQHSKKKLKMRSFNHSLHSIQSIVIMVNCFYLYTKAEIDSSRSQSMRIRYFWHANKRCIHGVESCLRLMALMVTNVRQFGSNTETVQIFFIIRCLPLVYYDHSHTKSN